VDQGAAAGVDVPQVSCAMDEKESPAYAKE
jgi:hypothetical protein